MSSLVGRCIDNRYDVIGVIGEGGMGVVARARHRFTGAEVALKVLHPQLMTADDAAARFLAEARAAAAIGHPAIVATTDAGTSTEGLYLVMELLKGETLGGAIRRGPVPFTTVRRVVNDLLDALAAAHAAGFIHRDIKPANVFLARGPAGVSLKLLDFGIAKVLAEAVETKGRTAAGVVMGTLAYMSPEQLNDSRNVDARTDLWAVGVIAFELATGRLPWEARSFGDMYVALTTRPPTNLEELMSAAPPDFGTFLRRALTVDPRRRFSSATEMQRELALLPDGPLTRRLDPRPSHDPFRSEDALAGATTHIPGRSASYPSVASAPTSASPATSATTRRVGSPAAKAVVLAGAGLAAVAVIVASLRDSRDDDKRQKDAADDAPRDSRRTASTTGGGDSAPPGRPPTSTARPALLICESACNAHRQCGAPLASDCASNCATDPTLVTCAERALAGQNICEDLSWCGSENYCKRPLRRGAASCNATAQCVDGCNKRKLGDVACSCGCSDGIAGAALQRLFNNNVCALTSCPNECGATGFYLACVNCALLKCAPEVRACMSN